MVAGLCHFLISNGVMARQNDLKTPCEKTKKRHAKRRKNEIRHAKRLQRSGKTRKRPCEIMSFKTLIFRIFAWRLFVISSSHLALFPPSSFCLAFFFIISSFLVASFRLALFRPFAWCYFVFSLGVFSLFRLFAWRLFIISSSRVAFFFVLF